ncbi:Fibronectin type III domain-containing protein [Arenibacter nanhaiticus]|uniref:Fibronectin type III domain-containing protein n=1 Tax=Arenibacter nanhaiticus TaxID=558155 RepID=A0A1M6GUA1_9FLAO|nr:fibronectin type III domain-containing protein [Arenibacter nanhaiticus]SHJ13514.1 Fibronectin type III domain-containing protein [Arenibacter nanhaiticus]
MKSLILFLGLLCFGLGLTGQNLHNQANAASIDNEANSITGWTGNANIISSTNNPFLGTFSINAASTASNGRECAYTFAATVGQAYTISIWARAGTQNFQPAFANWAGLTGFSTTIINSLNWTQYTWTLTASSTSPIIRIYTSPSSGGSTGDSVFFDSVSITAAGGGGDNQPPSAVTSLSASGTTATSTNLNWNASTDNVGVTGYTIFQNGTQVGSPTNTFFNVTGLNPSTSYAFTARARDAAGNTSASGNTVNVTTESGGGGATDYTSMNANLFTVDWRARDLFANRNVGIGTTNTQGHRLAVAGSIIAEEVKVALQTNWPDYIFKKDYRLPSLEEVELQIIERGYLLNIPSSKEMEENGVVLGDMVSRLLLKIEELTLYTIQQEKRINQLDEELKNMRLFKKD